MALKSKRSECLPHIFLVTGFPRVSPAHICVLLLWSSSRCVSLHPCSRRFPEHLLHGPGQYLVLDNVMTLLPLQVLQNSQTITASSAQAVRGTIYKGKERNETVGFEHGAKSGWMAQPDGEERKGSRRSRRPAHMLRPGCCCILDMDIIWCSGQFKMKTLSTSEGRLSLRWLYLEISPNIYSKDKVCVFPVIQRNTHHSENNACSLHLAHFYLRQEHLLLRTLRCLRTQCVHHACLPTARYLYRPCERVYIQCGGNEVWQHYTKGN